MDPRRTRRNLRLRVLVRWSPRPRGSGETEPAPEGSGETEPAPLRSGETGPAPSGSGETLNTSWSIRAN